MKKLKILSAILVLIGVAMVGVGGISTTQTQDFNGVQNSKLNLRVVKINKIIKERKPVKPLYNPYEYLKVIDVSFDPYQELMSGEPVTIYLTVKNNSGVDLTDGIVFRMSFGHPRENQNNVACLDAPDLGYTCQEFSNGDKYIEHTWDTWMKDEIKIVPVRMYITDESPYDNIKQTPAWYGFAKGDLSQYYIHYYPEVDGIYVYRVHGHLDVQNNIKIYVQPNILFVKPGGAIVYSVKVKNLDPTFEAEGVKVKLHGFNGPNLTCYVAMLYPSSAVTCSEFVTHEFNVGNIPAGGDKVIGYLYTKVGEDVNSGTKIFNILTKSMEDGSVARAMASNAKDLDYQENLGPIGGIEDIVEVKDVVAPPRAIHNNNNQGSTLHTVPPVDNISRLIKIKSQ